jgi:hypothetical protein
VPRRKTGANPAAHELAAITGAADKVVPLPPPREPAYAEPPAESRRFRVRVDLDGARPPIWRRLELRGDLRLDQVHDVLQSAFGWANSHLHAFRVSTDPLVDAFVTEFDLEEGEEGVPEADIRLDQVMATKGDRLYYEYDFGDSWDHTIAVEDVLPLDADAPAATVIDGRRACPPEDCGGIGEYAEILNALADPASADDESRERLDWLPDSFDPDEFDLTAHDAAVRDALRLAPGAVLPDAMSADLADLVHRSPWASGFALPDLIAEAELRAAPTGSSEERHELVRPYLLLLDLVGDGGVMLTQAGYLKPGVVTALADALGREDWWGKANREDLTPPVARLRDTATALGLVRRHRGRLVRAPKGRDVAGDPDAIWSVVVSSLPLGKELAERHAGVLALLGVAAGKSPYDLLTAAGSRLLEEAGWRLHSGEAMSGQDVHDLARATTDVISVLTRSWASRSTIPPAAQDLARAALSA